MNTDTNELRDLEMLARLAAEAMGCEPPENPASVPEGFTPVPPELGRAARHVLHGRPVAYVSRKSGGKLSRWAAQQRRDKARHDAKAKGKRRAARKRAKSR